MVGEALTPLVSDLQIYKPKRVAYSIGYWLFHISPAFFTNKHTATHTHARTHGTYYRYVKVRKNLHLLYTLHVLAVAIL